MKQAPGKRPRPEAPRRAPQNKHRKHYFTARWRRRMRPKVIARDGGLCQECLRQGRTEPGREVDHIQRAAEHTDKFWSLDNLQLLCTPCHSRKTVRGQ